MNGHDNYVYHGHDIHNIIMSSGMYNSHYMDIMVMIYI